MDAHQRRVAGSNVAHAEHDTLLHLRPIGTLKAKDPEMAETRRKIRFRDLGQHMAVSFLEIVLSL
jgi:hypothetical protein